VKTNKKNELDSATGLFPDEPLPKDGFIDLPDRFVMRIHRHFTHFYSVRSLLSASYFLQSVCVAVLVLL
jgi:hypothetical protein